jgi:hypothetical protein
MNKIHTLLTNKPSRLCKTDKLRLYPNGLRPSSQGLCKNQHIYITSDEETLSNNGDYYLGHPNYNTVHKWNMEGMHEGKQVWIKKIILTTDQDLIADDVQKIDDEFLKWFVKNPSCDEIETIHGLFNPTGRQVDPMNLGQNHLQCVWKYKIIIPQEEPTISEEAKERAKNYMSLKGALEPNQIKCYCGHTTMCDCGPLDEAKQEENEIIDISDHDGIGNAVDNLNNEPPQETLEEVADEYFKLSHSRLVNEQQKEYERELFIAGYKLAKERMYSEEDMINFAFDTYYYISKLMRVPFNQISENKLHAIENLKQFKKK